MGRHIVCLTFDFDAVSGFIARGMNSPTPVSRGEFGPTVAAPRLLELLDRRRIATTWFIPGHTLESFPAACLAVHEAGHEIGHHGWRHVSPAGLTRDEEEAELVRANEAIRRLTGRGARGYRSPAWDLSPHSVELLLAHGFRYDSSMMGDDYTPYHVRSGDHITLHEPARFGSPTALVEMPVSWTLDDYPHFEFFRTPNWILPGLASAGDVLENWLDDFRYLRENLEFGIITYTFHPFVIGRGHRMLMLERLIDAVSDLGAEFMSLEQALDAFEARS